MNCLKNAWYPIAWSTDIERNQLFARTLADIPMVLFRDQDGQVTALEDTCPHRAAPLSMGKLDDCTLQCPYHGLQFDANGECVHNPQGPISPRAKVRKFPTLEQYAAVFVWLGDPELAAKTSLPAFDHMDQENWYIGTGYLMIAGNYELESDNILDLSHIEFMHPLFSSPAVSQAKPNYEQDGNTVWSKRDIFNDKWLPEPMKQSFGAANAEAVDRWLHVRWDPPALMSLWAGGVETGKPVEEAVVVPQVHWFSPQSETETHYFFSLCFPKSLGPHMEQVPQQEIPTIKEIFEKEDKPIIEAQQLRIGNRPLEEMIKVHMPGDGGGIAARRVLKRLIDEEQNMAST